MLKINKTSIIYSAVYQVLVGLALGCPLANIKIQHQFLLEKILPEHLYNIGKSIDLIIKQLAETIQNIVWHIGDMIWDNEKPNGTPCKIMEVSKLNNLGWKASIDLKNGIKRTYG